MRVRFRKVRLHYLLPIVALHVVGPAWSEASAQSETIRGAAVPLAPQFSATRPGAAPAKQARAPTDTKGVAEKPALPSITELVMLARATLVSVSQANEANDYSVLHALAGPQLRATTRKEQLAAALSSLRARDIDLSPVTVIVPVFSAQPTVDEAGVLRMAGVFPTEPLQVRFALSYRNVDGVWRLEGLSIDTVQAAALTPPKSGASPAASERPRAPQAASATTPRAAAPQPAARAPEPAPRAPAPTAELDYRTSPPTTTKY